MKTIHKSVLLWHSAHEMFALVTDVQHYPEFLPWCDRTEVLERTADGMVARVGMSIGGLQQGFTTRNTLMAATALNLIAIVIMLASRDARALPTTPPPSNPAPPRSPASPAGRVPSPGLAPSITASPH